MRPGPSVPLHKRVALIRVATAERRGRDISYLPTVFVLSLVGLLILWSLTFPTVKDSVLIGPRPTQEMTAGVTSLYAMKVDPATSQADTTPSTPNSPDGLSCTSILTDGMINQTIASIYASSNGTWPSQSGVDREVAQLFQTICATPTFQSLVNAWGATNVSIDFYATKAGIHFANFSIAWVSWQAGTRYANLEFWNGNIVLDSVAGPFFSQSANPQSYAPTSAELSLGGVSWTLIGAVVGAALAVIAGIVLLASRRGPRTNGNELFVDLTEDPRGGVGIQGALDSTNRETAKGRQSGESDPLEGMI